jgi:hypothetical protein
MSFFKIVLDITQTIGIVVAGGMAIYVIVSVRRTAGQFRRAAAELTDLIDAGSEGGSNSNGCDGRTGRR